MSDIRMVKRIDGSRFIARFDRGRIVSAAPISEAIWNKLANYQCQLEREHRAWNLIRPHDNDVYANTWGLEMSLIVDSIHRHSGTGRMLENRCRAFEPTVFKLEPNGARVAAELFKKYGWPIWFNQEKFNETVATL